MYIPSVIGGSYWDHSNSIVTDAAGNAIITGYTYSNNYPVTTGAYQSTLTGVNAVLTKLNANGNDLVYSTFIGGNNYENSNSVLIDSAGYIYIAGITASVDYPTTAGVYQPSHDAGYYNNFVTKFNPAGSSLIYSTFVGEGICYTAATDREDNIYISGFTESNNYPTTPGAYQSTRKNLDDVFVTKLNSTGTSLIYSTYIGGNGNELSFSIAVDNSGNAYIAGKAFYSPSINYPTTPGSFQSTFGGQGGECFYYKIKSNRDSFNLFYISGGR